MRILTRRSIIALGLALLAMIIGAGIIIPFTLIHEDFQNTWMCVYSRSEGNQFTDITVRSNDEFIVVGYLNGSHVMGIDMAGKRRWNFSLPDKAVLPYRAISMSNGGLLIVGTSDKIKHRDLYLCLLDAQGLVVWERTYGHPDESRYYEVLDPVASQTTDGGIIIAAYEKRHVYSGTWLLRLNSTGFPLWNVSSYEYLKIDPRIVLQLPDEGFILAGRVYKDEDAILLRIDPSGLAIWNRTYGGSNIDYIASMVLSEDGGFVLTGATASFGAGSTDAWLIRTDSTGNILWTHTYGGSGSDGLFSMTQTKDGSYVLAGYTYSFGAGNGDAWLVCTTPNGTVLWNRTYGGINNDYVHTVRQTADEGFLILGYTNSFGAENGGAWLFKTDKFGHISQLPFLLGPLAVIGWFLSLGGALGFGIITADHFLSSRKAKEPPPTNSGDTNSQVP